MGGSLYDTWVDALNAKGAAYDFSKITNKNYANEKPGWANEYRTRKAKNTDLKALFDGKYETRAERHDNRPWFGKERTYRTNSSTAGLGIQFKLGRKFPHPLKISGLIPMMTSRWSKMARVASTRIWWSCNDS